MILISLIKGFLPKFNLKDWLLIGLGSVLIILSVDRCVHLAKIKSLKEEVSDKNGLIKLQSDNLSEIFRDKNGKNITVSSVVGLNSKENLELALKELGLVDEIKNLKRLISASKNVTSAKLPKTEQKAVLIKDSVLTKIYKADTVDRYFEIRENVKVELDSNSKIQSVTILRENISITDTISTIIEQGKLPKRIFRLPFLGFDGIGIAGERPITSKIKHSNPYIKTESSKIIFKKEQ